MLRIKERKRGEKKDKARILGILLSGLCLLGTRTRIGTQNALTGSGCFSWPLQYIDLLTGGAQYIALWRTRRHLDPCSFSGLRE